MSLLLPLFYSLVRDTKIELSWLAITALPRWLYRFVASQGYVAQLHILFYQALNLARSQPSKGETVFLRWPTRCRANRKREVE